MELFYFYLSLVFLDPPSLHANSYTEDTIPCWKHTWAQTLLNIKTIFGHITSEQIISLLLNLTIISPWCMKLYTTTEWGENTALHGWKICQLFSALSAKCMLLVFYSWRFLHHKIVKATLSEGGEAVVFRRVSRSREQYFLEKCEQLHLSQQSLGSDA